MRILIRTSNWAIWARRLGSFALPVAVIPIFMHRQALISSDTFQLIEFIAVGIALLGLALSLGAFVRLWLTGDRGWGRAALGLLFSLACLLPFAAGLYLVTTLPRVPDLSTDPVDPPVLVSGILPPPLTPEQIAANAARYPNAIERSYPLDPPQVFALASAMVQARGWDIVLRRAPPGPTDEGQINAIAVTLLGWRDEVSIRVSSVVEGSIVAMRSASLSNAHDLGANGARIEEFLTALDSEVTLMLRDMPAAAPPEPEPEPVAP